MFQGKTKQGVSIKSTYGMREADHRETWILVADRSRLRLFEQTIDVLGSSLDLREIFANPDGRKRDHELGSDRPGRTFDSHDKSHHGQVGGVRHAYGSRTLPEDHVTEDLIKHAVTLCASRPKQTAHLYVLAEPSLLGLMRPALKRALPKMELTFCEKDYAWLDAGDLEERLNEILGSS